MPKIPIYFVPGLAASINIFENLSLDKEKYELHFIKWKTPISKKEPLTDYAKRMCKEITHKKPILVGVSFGGIVVQEMSKHLSAEKVIIISSIKNITEFPKRLQIIRKTGIYKIVPTKILANLDFYLKKLPGKTFDRKAKTYEKYLSIKNEDYLDWAFYNVLHWQQKENLKNIIHIHGTEDHIFPLKNLKNIIKINKGTHAMILTKGKKISQHIHDVLTC